MRFQYLKRLGEPPASYRVLTRTHCREPVRRYPGPFRSPGWQYLLPAFWHRLKNVRYPRARRHLLEKCEDVASLQPAADDHLAGSVNTMHLKDRFGDIKTNCSNRLIWLLRIVGALATPISVALACPWRSRPQHHERTSRGGLRSKLARLGRCRSCHSGRAVLTRRSPHRASPAASSATVHGASLSQRDPLETASISHDSDW